MKEIRVQDLRIGNFVTKEYYGNRGIAVDSINTDGINIWIEPQYRFKQLRPIPITEELLLKLGGVISKVGNGVNLHGLLINFVDGMWIEYVSRVEIFGLHILQNVYYFRKMEELKIDLSCFGK